MKTVKTYLWHGGRLAAAVSVAAFLHGLSPASASPFLDPLGTYGVLAGSAVTNTGNSVIDGNVGVSPGSAISGFPPGTASSIDEGDAAAAQVQLTTAYNAIANLAPASGNPSCSTAPGVVNLTGENLGGLELTPGVYCFDSNALLTTGSDQLTLNDLGNSDATFYFIIGSTLTTASASSVIVTNGGGDDNIFWAIGSSATLGTTTEFVGNILAVTSITLNTGANITCGGALAENGAVTLDDNDISTSCPSGASEPVPEASTLSLFGAGLLGCAVFAVYRRRKQSGADLAA